MRDQNRPAQARVAGTMGFMPSIRGLDDFPVMDPDSVSPRLRSALARQGRAGAALRLYRRRGWNDSAVRFQFDRESAAVKKILLEEAFAYENPALF